MLHAVRKADMRAFPCRARDVCRIEEGSTNIYLTEPRVIEEFLKTIEPKYNAAVKALRAHNIDADTVYVIAGFVAYVATCSPAAVRLNSGPVRGALEATAALFDRIGGMPKAPAQFGGKTVSELLADGTIVLNIDSKYPQAIGIVNVMGHISNLGNSYWEILINEEASSPFFTSDYPIAIERSVQQHAVNRIVPLAPDIAIRVYPNLSHRKGIDFTFSDFGSKRRRVGLDEIRDLNRLIVRSAESLVFYRDDHPWVTRFIERHKLYRIEPVVRRIPIGEQEIVLTLLELRQQKITK